MDQNNNYVGFIDSRNLSYEALSELNDMKQHADKIIQGIKGLDEQDANRAIWELFQNAVDLSPNCEVFIRLTDEQFIFSHNGAPFTPLTLDCFFKQVSSKTLEIKKIEFDDADPVGQYGTGLLATHWFGKVVLIDGALKTDNGFVHLKNFKIDRNTDNWKILSERISELKQAVSKLLKQPSLKEEEEIPFTTFKYELDSKVGKEHAEKAIAILPEVLPFVFILNPRLKKVVVIDKNNNETIFQRGREDLIDQLFWTEVMINNVPRILCSVTSADRKVTVILPLSRSRNSFDLTEKLPKFFLYYPLYGTEKLGVNYIIHSRYFHPTEARDGLHIADENGNNIKEEEINHDLIEKASMLIFDFVRENAEKLNEPFWLAQIDFDTSSASEALNLYFEKLKKKWTEQFKTFEIVETAKGKIAAQDVAFWSPELLNDENSFEAISFLMNKYYPNSPIKSIVREWTKAITEWNNEDIHIVTIHELIEKVKIDASLEKVGNNVHLLSFYEYLIRNGHEGIFNKWPLIPNINGNFILLSGLNEPVNIPVILLRIAKDVMPGIPEQLVHPDFRLGLEFKKYKRKDFESNFNHAISTNKDHLTGKQLLENTLFRLIDYCKISNTPDAANVPIRMVQYIAQYYNYNDEIIVMSPEKEDELDLRASQKSLLRFFLNDLVKEDKEFVANKIEFLKNVIELGAFYDGYKEMFASAAVYPNLLYELRPQASLQIDGGIPLKIKEYYDKIIKADLPIDATLAHPSFNLLISKQEPITAKIVADRIEAALSNDGQYNDVNTHPYKKEILEIIQLITSEDSFDGLFLMLRGRRANVMLEMVEDEKIKKDLFSIVSLEAEQINLLGTLAEKENMAEIIRLGEQAVDDQRRRAADFQHKHKIGIHIENVLRERITSIVPERIKAEVIEQQDGQDIIIKIDNAEVYFLEVKSRWDASNPVRMSKNQTISAYNNRDRYALCTVDMTKFKGDNKYNVENIESIIGLIWVNKEIGDSVAHLQDILKQEKEIELIHLEGDFRTAVPMAYIEGGITLKNFEEFLVQYLRDLVTQKGIKN